MAADPVSLALRRHALRLTPVRQAALMVLVRSPFALSGAEIEKQLRLPFDRITLYRTLKTFEQKGLIHRVIDHSETVRYAVCTEPATVAVTADHVHFKCTACRHTYCLSQVAVPAVALPGGYRVVRGDYLVSGVCERCQPDAALNEE